MRDAHCKRLDKKDNAETLQGAESAGRQAVKKEILQKPVMNELTANRRDLTANRRD